MVSYLKHVFHFNIFNYLIHKLKCHQIDQSETVPEGALLDIVEKYYKDKIAILQELLRREKRDREIEHRAKIQFLSQLEREKKGEFKRQIDEVLMKFDEEDKKAEIDDNNQEEIEKIFNLYYKK